MASGVQACRGNWQEAERLGRESGDVLGGVIESVGEGSFQKVPLFHEIACCGRGLRCVARDDPDAANAVWTHNYRSDSVLGSMAIAGFERFRGGDWHQHMEQSARAWEQAQEGIEKVCFVVGVATTIFQALSLEGPGKTAAVAFATSPLLEALDLQMSSAALQRMAAAVGNLADVLPNDWFQNLEAIKLVRSPTLVVHGKVDDLIPLSHGEQLHEAAAQKATLPEDVALPKQLEVRLQDERGLWTIALEQSEAEEAEDEEDEDEEEAEDEDENDDVAFLHCNDNDETMMVLDAARQLADEVKQKLNEGALFAAVRNICTDSKIDGTESVRKKFGVGTDTAKTIHEVASKSLKDQGFVEFPASMGKQMKFCKPDREAAARADESRNTYHEYVERYNHAGANNRPKLELPEPAAKPVGVKQEKPKVERPRLVRIKVHKKEEKAEEKRKRSKEKQMMKKMKKKQKEKKRQRKEIKKRRRAAELAGEKLKAVLHEKKRRREAPSPSHSQSSSSSSSSVSSNSKSPSQDDDSYSPTRPASAHRQPRRMKQGPSRPVESAEASVRGLAQPPGQAAASSQPATAGSLVGAVPAALTTKAEQSAARRRWPAAMLSPKELRVVFVEDLSDESAADPRHLEVPPPIPGPLAAAQRGEASAASQPKVLAASEPPAPKVLPTAAKSKAPTPGERPVLPTAASAGEASAPSAAKEPAAFRPPTLKGPPTAAKSKAPTPGERRALPTAAGGGEASAPSAAKEPAKGPPTAAKSKAPVALPPPTAKAPTPVERAALPTAARAGQASAPFEAKAPAASRPATPAVGGVIDVELAALECVALDAGLFSGTLCYFLDVDEDDEAPLMAELGGTSSTSGSASSSQAPRSVLDPFGGKVLSFDEFTKARSSDHTQRIPRLRDKRPENSDDVDATLEQLEILNDLLQRSPAPEPLEAHVMALGEASAAKRARQSALLRRQLAESTISSHGGKRHGPLEDSSPFQRLQRRDDMDMRPVRQESLRRDKFASEPSRAPPTDVGNLLDPGNFSRNPSPESDLSEYAGDRMVKTVSKASSKGSKQRGIARSASGRQMTFQAFRLRTQNPDPNEGKVVEVVEEETPEQRARRHAKTTGLHLGDVRRIQSLFNQALALGEVKGKKLPLEHFRTWLCQHCGLDPEKTDVELTEEDFVSWYNNKQWSEEIMVPDPQERSLRRFCKKQGFKITEVERVKAAFDKADRDGSLGWPEVNRNTIAPHVPQDPYEMNGALDHYEFQQVYCQLEGIDVSQVNETKFRILWQEVDEDFSGSIDLMEFAKWRGTRRDRGGYAGRAMSGEIMEMQSLQARLQKEIEANLRVELQRFVVEELQVRRLNELEALQKEDSRHRRDIDALRDQLTSALEALRIDQVGLREASEASNRAELQALRSQVSGWMEALSITAQKPLPAPVDTHAEDLEKLREDLSEECGELAERLGADVATLRAQMAEGLGEVRTMQAACGGDVQASRASVLNQQSTSQQQLASQLSSQLEVVQSQCTAAIAGLHSQQTSTLEAIRHQQRRMQQVQGQLLGDVGALKSQLVDSLRAQRSSRISDGIQGGS
eukprot:s892_g7.t2